MQSVTVAKDDNCMLVPVAFGNDEGCIGLPAASSLLFRPQKDYQWEPCQEIPGQGDREW